MSVWQKVYVSRLQPASQRPCDAMGDVAHLHACGRILVYRGKGGWRYLILGAIEMSATATARTLSGAKGEAIREATTGGIVRVAV